MSQHSVLLRLIGFNLLLEMADDGIPSSQTRTAAASLSGQCDNSQVGLIKINKSCFVFCFLFYLILLIKIFF